MIMMIQTSGISVKPVVSLSKMTTKVNDITCLMEQLISVSHWLTKRTQKAVELKYFRLWQRCCWMLKSSGVFCRVDWQTVNWRFGRVFCLQLRGLSVHLLGLRYAVGGDSTLLRNIGNYLPVHAAWQPRKWILKKKKNSPYIYWFHDVL